MVSSSELEKGTSMSQELENLLQRFGYRRRKTELSQEGGYVYLTSAADKQQIFSLPEATYTLPVTVVKRRERPTGRRRGCKAVANLVVIAPKNTWVKNGGVPDELREILTGSYRMQFHNFTQHGHEM